jgi:hypothetical protein
LKLLSQENYRKEKERQNHMKEVIIKMKEDKMKEAKDLKTSNRLIKENVVILKDRIREENKQKKRMVSAHNHLLKSSFTSYKELKKEFINDLHRKEIEWNLNKLHNREAKLGNLKIFCELGSK